MDFKFKLELIVLSLSHTHTHTHRELKIEQGAYQAYPCFFACSLKIAIFFPLKKVANEPHQMAKVPLPHTGQEASAMCVFFLSSFETIFEL